jgi:hypothetical protein
LIPQADETKERPIVQSTPEYIRAHMSNLEPRFGSGDIARHNVETRARDRRERRARFSQHAAAIWRSLPFANNTAGTDSVASVEAT